jgi:hypothetical protein
VGIVEMDNCMRKSRCGAPPMIVIHTPLLMKPCAPGDVERNRHAFLPSSKRI